MVSLMQAPTTTDNPRRRVPKGLTRGERVLRLTDDVAAKLEADAERAGETEALRIENVLREKYGLPTL